MKRYHIKISSVFSVFSVVLICSPGLYASFPFEPHVIVQGSSRYNISTCAADLDGDGDQDVLSAESIYPFRIFWYENEGTGVFRPQKVIGIQADGIDSVHAADLDNDGDLDILVSYVSEFIADEKIAWYENNGKGHFSPGQIISTQNDGARSVAAADLDADGDLDVLSTSPLDGKIAWHKNDGAGTFSDRQVISVQAGFTSSVRVADLDSDGDLDLLSASTEDDKITWYANDGAATFDLQQIIVTQTVGASSVRAADLDNDGDLDVFSVSTLDGKLIWFENDGTGTFGPQQLIVTQTNDLQFVLAVDLDGDSDLDLLAVSYSDDKIVWYENNGTGQFGPEQVIQTQIEGVHAVTTADLDGDADIDVLSESDWDGIAWYENDGTGKFVAQSVTGKQIDGPVSVYVTDLDGDADPDVLSASYLDGQIAWYKNDGRGSFYGSQQVIATEIFWANFVSAADLDGDGDPDVIAAGYEQTAWYENDGTGNFGSEQIISEQVDPTSVSTADLDGDGDLDMVLAFRGVKSNRRFGIIERDAMLVWHENDGAGTFGPPQVITTKKSGSWSVHLVDLDGDGDGDILTASDDIAWLENDGSGHFQTRREISAHHATLVCVADLDSDSDLDVLSFSNRDHIVAWYENEGTGTFGSQQVISTQVSLTRLDVADLDNDGDPDVVSTYYNRNYGHRIVWHNNDGTGNFGSEHVISTERDSVQSLYAADLDSDGDQDILSAFYSDDKIVWYENDGTFSLFNRQQVISTEVLNTRSVHAADLDGDGDMDVVSASERDDKVAWYKNDGKGIFGDQQVISTQDDGPTSVEIADLDGDGDLDVLSASIRNPKIVWYENDGTGDFGPQQVISMLINTPAFPNNVSLPVYAADLDGDGDLDVLAAFFIDGKIAWYENNGKGAFGPEQVVFASHTDEVSVYPADLDMDGDLDIVASMSYEDPQIAWYDNDGTGKFGTPQVITSAQILNVSSISVSDLDSDGDPDILSTSGFPGDIAWYENNGMGTFGPQLIIDSRDDNRLLFRPQSVYATDLDGDGDIDVLSTGGRDIAWYENGGVGTFSAQQLISTVDLTDVESVFTADLDGDGDLDVLSADFNQITWYENE